MPGRSPANKRIGSRLRAISRYIRCHGGRRSPTRHGPFRSARSKSSKKVRMPFRTLRHSPFSQISDQLLESETGRAEPSVLPRGIRPPPGSSYAIDSGHRWAALRPPGRAAHRAHLSVPHVFLANTTPNFQMPVSLRPYPPVSRSQILREPLGRAEPTFRRGRLRRQSDSVARPTLVPVCVIRPE
jgi:hypothetical protein